MIDLRFSSELYSGFAIDSAVKTYSGFAEFVLEREPEVFVVRLTALGEHSEPRIADEFSNYALGATIEERQKARD